MGDINVDHQRLQEPGYHLVNLARKVVDFQVEEGYTQMVEMLTREQLVVGTVKKSLLDVAYCNKVERILAVHQEVVGRSDHQGVRVMVSTKTKLPRGQSSRRRCYKGFDTQKFLYGIQLAKIDDKYARRRTSRKLLKCLVMSSGRSWKTMPQ